MLARFILLLCCVTAAVAQQIASFAQQTANPSPAASATILKYVNQNNGADGYFFEYETSDGTFRTERGNLKNRGTSAEAMVVTGRASWVTPEGQRITLDFTADENGYRPVYS